ncbi:hypothetical protein BC567DRAFT_268166 [Phyllosticta citribraziliensis]
MAGNSGFQNATKWHHEHPHPYTDPLKLGGIHRAQLWMKGANNHFFVAEWAQLRREDQLVAYQLLRNFRMEMLKSFWFAPFLVQVLQLVSMLDSRSVPAALV